MGSADILPLDAFIVRLWEDALYSGRELPLLLTPAQEQAMWEEMLAGSDLLSIAQTAAQCRDAWRLAHAWRIPAGPGGDDAQAFREWARKYEARTRGEIDAARLPDFIRGWMKELKKPNLLVAYAFDIVPPQTREFLSELSPRALRSRGQSSGRAVKLAFRSARQELERRGLGPRAAGGRPAARIPVVRARSRQRRQEAARVFSRVMQPGYNLPGAAEERDAIQRLARPSRSAGAPLVQFRA